MGIAKPLRSEELQELEQFVEQFGELDASGAVIFYREKEGGPKKAVVNEKALTLDLVNRLEAERIPFLKVSEEDFNRLRTLIVKETTEEFFLQLNDIGETADDSKIAQLLDYILSEAVNKRASDIHLFPTLKQGTLYSVVKFRVDGDIKDFFFWKSATVAVRLINKLLNLAGLQENPFPQDGQFSRRITGKEKHFRLSVVPIKLQGQTNYFKATVRLLSGEEIRYLTLEKLGFEPQELKSYRDALVAPKGMIIDTGPTGQGKSTTLLVSVKELVEERKRKGMPVMFYTIEDPVEVELANDSVVQIEAKNDDPNLSFAAILRNLMRQDPDGIMVGEIRDRETAKTAVEAAITGHLLLTTTHADDAVKAVIRLRELGIQTETIGSSLQAILSQRLLKKLCPECRKRVEISDEVRRKYGIPFKEAYTVGDGCPACGGRGVIGRTAVVEVLRPSVKVQSLIAEGAGETTIRYALKEEGFRNMWKVALVKAERGEVSIEEVIMKVPFCPIINGGQAEKGGLSLGYILWPKKKIEVKVGPYKGYLYDVAKSSLSVILEKTALLTKGREYELKVKTPKGEEVYLFMPFSFKLIPDDNRLVVGGKIKGELDLFGIDDREQTDKGGR